MKDLSRRDLVRLLVAAGGTLGFAWTPAEVGRASHRTRVARAQGQSYQPEFFTPHEWQTVRLLVDIIIPRDERSGSATDAMVPEFMDFIMIDGDSDERRTAMRGGLAWLDIESRERFTKNFIDCTDEERTAVLDDIAWPERARPAMSHGVRFFNAFRDLTASGFWSSKMGIEDLTYMGNVAVAEWNGCPQEQLDKLGVSYEQS